VSDVTIPSRARDVRQKRSLSLGSASGHHDLGFLFLEVANSAKPHMKGNSARHNPAELGRDRMNKTAEHAPPFIWPMDQIVSIMDDRLDLVCGDFGYARQSGVTLHVVCQLLHGDVSTDVQEN
jgi:hypothetical protein